MVSRYLYPIVLATCFLPILQACSPVSQNDLAHSVKAVSRPKESGQLLWQQAMLASSRSRPALLIQAASYFLGSGKIVWAKRALSALAESPLTSLQKQQLQLLQASCLLKEHQYHGAERRLPSWAEVSTDWPKEQQSQWCVLQRDIAQALGELPQLILAWQRLALQYPANSAMRTRMLNALWHSLVKRPVVSLQVARDKVLAHSLQAGWLDLAIDIAKKGSATERQHRLRAWMKRYPNHPAKVFVPMQAVEKPFPPIKKVALLLPLSGRFQEQGQAIRRGFYAAYYEQKKENTSVLPKVAVYNTASDSVLALYRKAVAEGASMVIGPLLKPNVQALRSSGALSRPTIALNTIKGSSSLLYQFALDPTIAASMIADRLAEEGRWHVAVVVDNAPWAKRMESAFEKRWASYRGVVVGTLVVKKGASLSKDVRHFMLVSQSSQRARDLKRVLHKRTLRFVPSRRGDIDAVVLFASQGEAQQIKPFLRYYFAGNLPVYAGPSVYERLSAVNENADLNGIQFLTTPWQVMPSKGLPSSIAHARSMIQGIVPHAVAKKEARFFAMGADAFELTYRLPMLAALPDLSFYGGTGVLSVTPEQHIVRQLIWARFYRSSVRPL